MLGSLISSIAKHLHEKENAMKKLFVLLTAVVLTMILAVPVFALSPPWLEYSREIKMLFGEDPEIEVDYDEDELILLVESEEKADAIGQLLGTEKEFGNVTLKITVIPANAPAEPTKAQLVAKAFKGNPVVKDIVTISDPMLPHFSFVVFEKKVVQFWNDNLGDLNGLKSTLYQTIAEEVLGGDGEIYYCTEPGDALIGVPLGEWP